MRLSLSVILLIFAGITYSQTGDEARLVESFQKIVPKIAGGKTEEVRAALPELQAMLAQAQRVANASITGPIQLACGCALRTLGENSGALRYHRDALRPF